MAQSSYSHANDVTWSSGTQTRDVLVDVPIRHKDLPYTVPSQLNETVLGIFCRLMWQPGSERPWLLFLQGEFFTL
jgi:hypothetical protein